MIAELLRELNPWKRAVEAALADCKSALMPFPVPEPESAKCVLKRTERYIKKCMCVENNFTALQHGLDVSHCGPQADW